MEPLILSGKSHIAFRQSVKKFVEKEVKPNAMRWENDKRFPTDLLKKLGKGKFLGLSLPKSIRGGGRDFWHEVIFSEELARSKLWRNWCIIRSKIK